MEEDRPSNWMNLAFAPGARDALEGRDGLLAQIRNDGVLRTIPPGRRMDEGASGPHCIVTAEYPGCHGAPQEFKLISRGLIAKPVANH